jgi:hypothetical protein
MSTVTASVTAADQREQRREPTAPFLGQIPAWAQMLAVVGGIISFSVTEWDKKIHDDQAAATHVSEMSQASFAMVDAYNSPDFIRIRKKITDIWFRHPTHDGLCSRDYAMTSEAQDAITFVDFFDKVDLCMKNSICDKSVINETLAPNAAAFSPMLTTLIGNYQTVFHATNFGAGFKDLTEAYLKQSGDTTYAYELKHGGYKPADLCAERGRS